MFGEPISNGEYSLLSKLTKSEENQEFTELEEGGHTSYSYFANETAQETDSLKEYIRIRKAQREKEKEEIFKQIISNNMIYRRKSSLPW